MYDYNFLFISNAVYKIEKMLISFLKTSVVGVCVYTRVFHINKKISFITKEFDPLLQFFLA